MSTRSSYFDSGMSEPLAIPDLAAALEGRLPEAVTEAELLRRYPLTRWQLLRVLGRIAGEGWVTRLPSYGWRFAETLSSPETYAKSAAFRAVIEPAALSEPGYRLEPQVLLRLRRHEH